MKWNPYTQYVSWMAEDRGHMIDNRWGDNGEGKDNNMCGVSMIWYRTYLWWMNYLVIYKYTSFVKQSTIQSHWNTNRLKVNIKVSSMILHEIKGTLLVFNTMFAKRIILYIILFTEPSSICPLLLPEYNIRSLIL